MKPQVEVSHYFSESSHSKKLFISYWHQITEIRDLSPKRVLEIGIGNGFVSKFLKDRKLNVITLDFDERLNPDVVGSVLDIPFPDNLFNVVACYEVLEHMPYENFHIALSEIFRVSDSYVILSFPDINRVCQFSIDILNVGHLIKLLIPLPRFKKAVHKFDGEHFWEIGKAEYPLNKIIKDIQVVGFKIKKTYRVFENPYHRFFILHKDVRLQQNY